MGRLWRHVGAVAAPCAAWQWTRPRSGVMRPRWWHAPRYANAVLNTEDETLGGSIAPAQLGAHCAAQAVFTQAVRQGVMRLIRIQVIAPGQFLKLLDGGAP